jgi:hypothetical protein
MVNKQEHYMVDVSGVAAAGLKDIARMLKTKGYVGTTTRQSAMYETQFVLGERRITVGGWHGTGKGNRNYGDMKTISHVYDSKKEGYEPVMELTMKQLETLTPEQQMQFVVDVLVYVKANA